MPNRRASSGRFIRARRARAVKHTCSAIAVAALVVLGGCRDARNDARAELTRLGAAMTRYAAQHGRYPETVDGARPSDATNLAFTPSTAWSCACCSRGGTATRPWPRAGRGYAG